jgi:phage shock protein PspC (stress-responsive transcriptional regulator)
MSHNDVISCFVATIGVLYAVDDQRVHFVMTAVLGATIGMVVYLILALDHPLWGEVSVAPTAFEVVAESMDRSLNPMTPGERRVSSNGGFAP